jgi:hypothetical protein
MLLALGEQMNMLKIVRVLRGGVAVWGSIGAQ